MEILIYILKSSAILSLFFLVYEFFLKKDTFFILNRIFLLTGILASIFLPFLTFTKTVVVEKAVVPISNSSSEVLHYFPNSETISVVENVSFLSSMEWFQVLLIVYAIGVLFFLTRFVKSLAALHKILRYRPKSYQENGIRFIETDKKTNPFTFFKTVVYNPSRYDESELEMILYHEKTHANQWHSADIILGQLFLVFQWMNPIAWLYTKRIDQNLEFIADLKTTVQKFPKKTYQISLLRAAYSGELSLPVNNFHSFTKIRILMLNKAKSNFINRFKILMVLPLLMVFLLSFQTETIAQIKNTPTVETSNDPISKTDVEKLNKILNAQKQNSIINFNGKNKKVKELLPAFYKIESLQFNQEGLPIIKAEKSGKPNLEASLEEIPTGLYLLVTENYDLVLIIRNLKNQNDAMYVFKRENPSEINSLDRNSSESKTSETKSSDETRLLKTEKFPKAVKPEKTEPLEKRQKLHGDFFNKDTVVSVEVRYEIKGDGRGKSERSHLNRKEFLKESSLKETINNMDPLKIEHRDQMDKGSGLKKVASAKVLNNEGTKNIVTFNENNNVTVLRFEIDENSSDQVLDNVVEKFADAGVDFKYKIIKRNREGKITKIRMTLNNRNGSQSKINNQSSTGIGGYILGLNGDGSIYIINKN